MSRFDGWLVRFIMFQGTPAALTIKSGAKGACIRPEVFAQALRDPKLLRLDAQHLGIDPFEMLAIREWMEQYERERDLEESMVASAESVKRTPDSEKYRGSRTRLGVSCPNPGGARSHRDELNLPINPIQHPEPQGEWHAGLDAAGVRKR